LDLWEIPNLKAVAEKVKAKTQPAAKKAA